MSVWPFTMAELTAGLRRYFAEPSLQVKSLSEQPVAIAGAAQRASMAAKLTRGLRVEYAVGPHTLTVDGVVKQPRGASRMGLSSAGAREIGVYRSLAAQLPMATPALVAADSSGRWLVLEAIDAGVNAGAERGWAGEDYVRAVGLLAALHERFWDLAEDLSAYTWLARPLTLDYEIHVYAAAYALGTLVRDEWPPLIADSAAVLGTLGQIISQADRVVQPLRAAPFTLLHGDFWAGSVIWDEEGDAIVWDWQSAGVGPGVLDLVALVMTCQWELDRGLPVPANELMAQYRSEMARCVRVSWSDEVWMELWDSALLWRFMQEVLVWLAGVPRGEFDSRAHQFDEIWLKPVLEAARRRLEPVLADR